MMISMLCYICMLLLLAHVFENLWNMCVEIYELDPAKRLSAPWLVWQAALKKTKVRSYFLTWSFLDVILIVGKGIRGGIYRAIHQYAKGNIK